MKHLSFRRKDAVFFRMFILLFILFMMTGCKKNTELENYKANMNQFFENVKIFDSSINAIDPNSETAVSELLALLDSMDTSFAQMASLEVPDGFPGVAELADEASSCMSEAVSYYHQAYEGGYDASLEDIARQKYERANMMLQYIVSIFRGDIPEELYTSDEGTEEIPESTEPVEE